MADIIDFEAKRKERGFASLPYEERVKIIGSVRDEVIGFMLELKKMEFEDYEPNAYTKKSTEEAFNGDLARFRRFAKKAYDRFQLEWDGEEVDFASFSYMAKLSENISQLVRQKRVP